MRGKIGTSLRLEIRISNFQVLPQRSQSVHNLRVQSSSMDAEWICAKINKECLYQHDRLSEQVSEFRHFLFSIQLFGPEPRDRLTGQELTFWAYQRDITFSRERKKSKTSLHRRRITMFIQNLFCGLRLSCRFCSSRLR